MPIAIKIVKNSYDFPKQVLSRHRANRVPLSTRCSVNDTDCPGATKCRARRDLNGFRLAIGAQIHIPADIWSTIECTFGKQA